MMTPRPEEDIAVSPAPSLPLNEGVLTRYREALASQVARKPGQSALLALAVGALGAALLRSLVTRRRR